MKQKPKHRLKMTWRLRYALLQVQYRNLKWSMYKLEQLYKRLLDQLRKEL